MTETITLNLIPDTTELPVLHCSQFDDGRIMYVDLVEGDQPFILAEGSVVKVNIRKLDNNVISNVCTYETIEVEEVEEFSRVTIIATAQMTACYGRSYGELQISVNDTVIGTLNFFLDVEKDPMQGGIDSASEIDNLTGQIEDIVEEVIGVDYYNKSQADNLLSGKANASDLDNYYTKTQADNLLSGKANASDLDNYYTKTQADNLLSGKANASDLDNYYTKTEVDQKFLDIMPVKSVAKSPIASFYTSIGNYPIIDLTCFINPTQSGSGDPAPDNVRPITGVSSVNVTRTGKNLCKPLTLADSEFFLSVNYRIKRNAMPKARCIISFVDKDPTIDMTGINFGFVDSKYDGTPLESSEYRWVIRNGVMQTEKRNIPDNGDESVFLTGLIAYPRTEGTWNKIIAKYDIQIELGSTVTDYEPYTGNTYLIQLGDTYYGATLDVVSGKLVVDWISKELSSLNWSYDSTYTRFYADAPNSSGQYQAARTTPFLCSDYIPITDGRSLANVPDKSAYFGASADYIYIKDLSYSDTTNFVNSLGSNTIVYPVATPIEIDLTPTQINTLLYNNIWHDANGDIELKFKETIQDWLDQM